MSLALDHLVHFVYQDLENITERLQTKDILAKKGGSHSDWGTYNHLAYFDNLAYIEWLAVEHEEIAQTADNPLIRQLMKERQLGDHLAQMAFRTTDIQHAENRLKERGFPTILLDGKRRRDDGSLLEWTMLFIKDDSSLPFLIEWSQSDHERKRDLINQSMLDETRSLQTVYYATKNVEDTVQRWESAFSMIRGSSVICDELAGEGVEIPLENAKLVFMQPTGDGHLQDVLFRKGEGPFDYWLV